MADNLYPFKPPKGLLCYDVEALNKEFALILIGDRAAVLWEDGRPADAGGEGYRLLSIDAFKHWTANRLATQSEEKVPVSKLWLQDPRRRQYSGFVFAPPPDPAPEGAYNLWRGFALDPDPAGDWSLLKEHLRANVAQGDDGLLDWVMAWFADLVQRPGGRRPGTSLVLRGRQGCGKTIVGQAVGALFPPHWLLVDSPRYVVGQFNAHLTQCLLLQADEGFWAGDKQAEGRLKGLVTGHWQMVERKGYEPIALKNHVRLLVTSNHDWVVPAGLEERRFAVLDVGDGRLQDRDFFGRLWAQLEAGGLAGFLHALQTFTPAKGTDIGRVPATAALYEQKVATLSAIESWWLDCLKRGAIAPNGVEWKEQISTRAVMASYRAHAEAAGVPRRSAEVAVGLALKKLLKPVPTPAGDRRPWPQRFKAITEVEVQGMGGPYTEHRRDWVYRLPPLEDCRVAFEVLMGQGIEWDEET